MPKSSEWDFNYCCERMKFEVEGLAPNVAEKNYLWPADKFVEFNEFFFCPWCGKRIGPKQVYEWEPDMEDDDEEKAQDSNW